MELFLICRLKKGLLRLTRSFLHGRICSQLYCHLHCRSFLQMTLHNVHIDLTLRLPGMIVCVVAGYIAACKVLGLPVCLQCSVKDRVPHVVACLW